MNRRPLLPLSFVLLFVSARAVTHLQDGGHASLTSEVFATYAPTVEERTPESMAAAANAFLAALGDDLAEQAALTLDSSERQLWTNVPPRGDEGGVRLGDCDETQLQRACDLLATLMSAQGYERTRDIMLADDLLLRGESRRGGFGAENFWLAIFGTPAPDGAWALQLDGHHLALNLTLHGERMTLSPSFIGTQPSAFERTGARVEPMGDAVDGAFALVRSLTDEQRAQAVIGDRRGRIRAGAGRDGVVPEPVGVECSAFDDEQRALVSALLSQFVGDLPESAAGPRMRALQSEIDQMTFAWSGPIENPSDVSFALQGPTLILEYACQDLGGDPLDHLHSIYRDPTNEYGATFGAQR